MGLLDDAIREHLDLKRRHGADPSEIERAEREALGPVRRQPDVPEDLGGDYDVAGGPAGYVPGDEPAVYEPGEETAIYEQREEPELPYHRVEGAGGLERSASTNDLGPQVVGGGREHGEGWEEAFDDDEELFGESAARAAPPLEPESASPLEPESATPPEPDAAPPPPPEDAPKTVEYNLEEEREDPAGKEDMLEATPEFLQGPPDHDRLWFEQRHPRDFDFDG